MIRIACQTITWGPEKIREHTAEVLKEIKKAGFNGVEIGARHLDHSKPEYYSQLLGENGLDLVALHVGGDFLDHDSVNRQVENIGKTVEFAVKLGVGYIFLSGTYRKDKTGDDYKFEAQTYNRIGGVCKENGIKLCYHNHDWEIVNGLMGLKILLDNTGNDLVYFVPDVGWVTRGGADPVKLIEETYDRVEAVHFKDFTKDNDFTELGSGIVNFKGVYESVKSRKDLWIVSEQDTSSKTPLESASINCKYIESLVR